MLSGWRLFAFAGTVREIIRWTGAGTPGSGAKAMRKIYARSKPVDTLMWNVLGREFDSPRLHQLIISRSPAKPKKPSGTWFLWALAVLHPPIKPIDIYQ